MIFKISNKKGRIELLFYMLNWANIFNPTKLQMTKLLNTDRRFYIFGLYGWKIAVKKKIKIQVNKGKRVYYFGKLKKTTVRD